MRTPDRDQMTMTPLEAMMEDARQIAARTGGTVGGKPSGDRGDHLAKVGQRHEEALQRFLAYLTEHPNSSPTEIGNALGLSRAAAASYISEFMAGGHIVRVGKGRYSVA